MEELVDAADRIAWISKIIMESHFLAGKEDLRKVLGCDKNSFDAFMKGEVDSGSEILFKISSLFNVNMEWLQTGERLPFYQKDESRITLLDDLSGEDRILAATMVEIPPEEQRECLETLEQTLLMGGERAIRLAMMIESLYTALELRVDNDLIRQELIAEKPKTKALQKKLEQKGSAGGRD